MPNREFEKHLKQARLDEQLINNCKSVLTDSATAFIIPGSKRSLKFKKVILMDDNYQKITKPLDKPNELIRSLSINISDYRPGQLTIISS